MTEKQAWLELAERFRRADKGDGRLYRTPNGCCCLCDELGNLPLGPRVFSRMVSKIVKAQEARGKLDPLTFLWSPYTEYGRKQRVKFCMENAK